MRHNVTRYSINIYALQDVQRGRIRSVYNNQLTLIGNTYFRRGDNIGNY